MMRSARHGKYPKLRWGGAALSFVLLVGFGAATFGMVSFHRGRYLGGLFQGCLKVKSAQVIVDAQQRAFVSGWRRTNGPLQMTWWPSFMFPSWGNWRIHIPLWIPLILVGVPTIVLWRRDRGYPPGHCASCGYDLTGNESGVCPECGTKVNRAAGDP